MQYSNKFNHFIEEQEITCGLEVFISQSQDASIAIGKGNDYVLLAQDQGDDKLFSSMFISDAAFDRLYKVMTEIKEEQNASS